MAEVKSDKKVDKKVAPVDSELFIIIFLMLIIIVVPLAISVWDIGTPLPGFSGFEQSI